MFDDWLTALEARHLADLRVQELTRALRAVSVAYVERRPGHGQRALDSAGKRAAFALFYAPLHFLTTDRVVRALAAHDPPPRGIVDLGCGTGAAGAAWSLAAGRVPIAGIDRHPWAVEEARWTYQALGLTGRVRTGDATRVPAVAPGTGIVAAYVLNELAAEAQARLLEHLLTASTRGARVLILEPIARRLAPWWNGAAARVEAAGWRADEWRFAVDLPPLLRMLDRAAGFDHRELTVRTLYSSGAAGEPIAAP